MLLDFHTHAFPDSVAPRAMAAMSKNGGALHPALDGTIGALKASMERNDARCVLLPVATNPDKLFSVNRWVLEQASERVIPFGGVHPFARDAVETLDWLTAHGVRGIKLHPEYQRFDPGDERLFPFYREIGRRGLITVFHAGCDPAYMPPALLRPDVIERILPYFGGAPVVAAHLGGYLMWDAVARMTPAANLYLDTAYLHGRVIRPQMEAIIARFGVGHILFGSDSPWDDTGSEFGLVESLDLSHEEKQRILHQNGESLLGLEQPESGSAVPAR
ncbi:MAG: amidohydrolase family protein [Clostridia bacterium]|nr:amidohydrolase family protein [Clostridia bacterium]